LPIDGINSELLLSKISNTNKYVASKVELLNLIRIDKNEVIVTLGAGDIDRLVEPIKQILLQK